MENLQNIIRAVASARHDLRYADWCAVFANLGIEISNEITEGYGHYLNQYIALAEGATDSKTDHHNHIAKLQDWLRKENIDFFLLPRTDHYHNEFLSLNHERIAFLTGFTGSNGFVILSQNDCVLFSDSRYTIQMSAQTPDNVTCITCHHGGGEIENYLGAQLKKGNRVGFPSWQVSIKYQRLFFETAQQHYASLEGFITNPIDLFWQTRPPAPLALIEVFDKEFYDCDCAQKIKLLRTKISQNSDNPCQAIFISDLTLIAWLLNLRGGDVPYTPIFLSLLLVTFDKIILFVDARKINANVKQYCADYRISLKPFDDLPKILPNELSAKSCLLDNDKTPAYIEQLLQDTNCEFHHSKLPMQQMRAQKTQAQIANLKQAHIIDGVAMVRFLAGLAQQSECDEIQIAEQLEKCRAQNKDYCGASFPTIAGINENGAIIHYRARKNNFNKADGQALLLLDSGGQYQQATTDITRTIAFGSLDNDAIKQDYTAVLKCHIALAGLHFPAQSTGAQIDAICRYPLWQQGKNYQHSTGHGVGTYLSVHEGPYNISPFSNAPLAPNIVLSNEPGIYHEGKYGIRIENLILVKPSHINPDWLCFETLTLCPMDLSLIKIALLSDGEIRWLNDYHTKVRESLMPHLQNPDDKIARDYLIQATRSI